MEKSALLQDSQREERKESRDQINRVRGVKKKKQGDFRSKTQQKLKDFQRKHL